MARSKKLNLARIVYQAYPDRDLLPINPKQDCRNLKSLHRRATRGDLGDTLLQFLALEIVEGGGGTLDGAVRVVARARDDVDKVLAALLRAQNRRRRRKGTPP